MGIALAIPVLAIRFSTIEQSPLTQYGQLPTYQRYDLIIFKIHGKANQFIERANGDINLQEEIIGRPKICQSNR